MRIRNCKNMVYFLVESLDLQVDVGASRCVSICSHSSIIRPYWHFMYGNSEQFEICQIFGVGVIRIQVLENLS